MKFKVTIEWACRQVVEVDCPEITDDSALSDDELESIMRKAERIADIRQANVDERNVRGIRNEEDEYIYED